MARDTLDGGPIGDITALAETLAVGAKPPTAFRIGTEHEKFPFYLKDLQPVPYDGSRGIRAILEGMETLLGWERISDAGNIIGLVDPVAGGAISIEPGGQFELSGAPLETVHQTCREVNAHLAQVNEVANPLDIGFMGIGMTPTWTRGQVPVMPKSRYDIMARYMPKVGAHGLDMMFRTATVQVNLDFSSESDMVKKLRISLALQPVATALFANSPFTDGRINGDRSHRAHIWLDTDPDRTGGLEFAFNAGFGFETYVEWALDVPMYFVKRGDIYHETTDVTFRQFLDGALRQRLPDVEPTLGDWNNHLSTLFPDVRLKRYLEMRGADAGPRQSICALPAFWVGLLYDDDVLEEAYNLIMRWTAEERATMRAEVPRLALRTPFRNGTVRDVAHDALRLAMKGLEKRACLNEYGYDERIHLMTLEDRVATGHAPADEILRLYESSWGYNLAPLFAAAQC